MRVRVRRERRGVLSSVWAVSSATPHSCVVSAARNGHRPRRGPRGGPSRTVSTRRTPQVNGDESLVLVEDWTEGTELRARLLVRGQPFAAQEKELGTLSVDDRPSTGVCGTGIQEGKKVGTPG